MEVFSSIKKEVVSAVLDDRSLESGFCYGVATEIVGIVYVAEHYGRRYHSRQKKDVVVCDDVHCRDVIGYNIKKGAIYNMESDTVVMMLNANGMIPNDMLEEMNEISSTLGYAFSVELGVNIARIDYTNVEFHCKVADGPVRVTADV